MEFTFFVFKTTFGFKFTLPHQKKGSSGILNFMMANQLARDIYKWNVVHHFMEIGQQMQPVEMISLHTYGLHIKF